MKKKRSCFLVNDWIRLIQCCPTRNRQLDCCFISLQLLWEGSWCTEICGYHQVVLCSVWCSHWEGILGSGCDGQYTYPVEFVFIWKFFWFSRNWARVTVFENNSLSLMTSLLHAWAISWSLCYCWDWTPSPVVPASIFRGGLELDSSRKKNLWNYWGWMFINVVFLPFRTLKRMMAELFGCEGSSHLIMVLLHN